ncbi:hypothetical protein [Megalodesulfovibrio gigas]|uniref:Uncharacterized protein n=1 Tax=Megalodesulfovibrio gigas (strain ATCC 19364 / DSM 1382 / NCIMB 9332 / VKM B-1759) TaxID=1121448 RepID=T2GD89_MEGG1|nr:hypothetical protein [Megalodesulfovibrio gigas]AGW13887.1 hypothetical protein DGI_2123 [Megalodesulfovibrio gigas DSM 1382 = ATCC 19364]
MSWNFAIPRPAQYWAVTVLLAGIVVAGALGTPEIAQRLIPEMYFDNQLFWTGRQMVYAERDTVYTSSSQAFLEEMLHQPQPMVLHNDGSLKTAMRKMVARKQRAVEKANLLRFKFERLQRQYALTMGTARDPQPVEGL